jgi:hypothetical protein
LNAKPEGVSELAPEFNREYVEEQEQDMRKRLQQLHDEGVIDLDAPLREIASVAEKNAKERGGGEPGQADAYWLVGSQSWFRH